MRERLIKYRILLISLVLLAIVLLSSWSVFSSKVSLALQERLIGTVNEELNGRVQVGNIDLSLLGWIRIKDVSLYNKDNQLLAQSSIVNIRYRLSDLTGGSLTVPRMEEVSLEGVELWLEEGKEGWNWESLLKEKQNGETDFLGKLHIQQATVNVKSGLISRKLEDVKGILDFHDHPAILLDLTGKVGQTNLSVSGRWAEKNPSELVIKTGDIHLKEFLDIIPSTQEIRLEDGTLQGVKVVATRASDEGFRYQVAGEFSGMQLAGKIGIREGRGTFNGDSDGIHFPQISCIVSGQQADGQGKIIWGTENKGINFTLSLPDVDPALVSSELTVQRPLAVQVSLTGQLAQPDIAGSFSVPQLTVSDTAITGINGNFRYLDNRLLLRDVSGTAYQGTLLAAGEILIDSQHYEFDLQGQGMNSSRLTDKDVQGPLDFSGHLSGRGLAATTEGNFVIYDGKAYGVSFQRINGHFVKTNSGTDISGLAIQTALGTIHPDQLGPEVFEQLNRQNIPEAKEELKRAVTDKLIQRIFR